MRCLQVVKMFSALIFSVSNMRLFEAGTLIEQGLIRSFISDVFGICDRLNLIGSIFF